MVLAYRYIKRGLVLKLLYKGCLHGTPGLQIHSSWILFNLCSSVQMFYYKAHWMKMFLMGFILCGGHFFTLAQCDQDIHEPLLWCTNYRVGHRGVIKRCIMIALYASTDQTICHGPCARSQTFSSSGRLSFEAHGPNHMWHISFKCVVKDEKCKPNQWVS